MCVCDKSRKEAKKPSSTDHYPVITLTYLLTYLHALGFEITELEGGLPVFLASLLRLYRRRDCR